MLQLNNQVNKLSSNRIVINGLDYKYNTTIGRYHCKFQSGNGHDNLIINKTLQTLLRA